jgi:hypothetical protein
MTTKSTSLRIARITGYSRRFRLHGYKSRYVKTKSGACICSLCCESDIERFALDDSWLVVRDGVNKRDPYLFCDNCLTRIEIFQP